MWAIFLGDWVFICPNIYKIHIRKRHSSIRLTQQKVWGLINYSLILSFVCDVMAHNALAIIVKFKWTLSLMEKQTDFHNWKDHKLFWSGRDMCVCVRIDGKKYHFLNTVHQRHTRTRINDAYSKMIKHGTIS